MKAKTKPKAKPIREMQVQ